MCVVELPLKRIAPQAEVHRAFLVLDSLERGECVLEAPARDLKSTLQSHLNIGASQRVYGPQSRECLVAFIDDAVESEGQDQLGLNLEGRPTRAGFDGLPRRGEDVFRTTEVELDPRPAKGQERGIVNFTQDVDQAAGRRLVVLVARNSDPKVDDEGLSSCRALAASMCSFASVSSPSSR